MTDNFMMTGVNRAEAWRFFLFLLTGGLSAAVNLGSRLVLSLALPYEAAVALAYLTGMVAAFMLFRSFVFEPGGFWISEFKRFTIVNAFGFCLVWITSIGLARLVFPALAFTWHAETVAHVIGVMTPVVSSYYGHKKYSFAKAEELGDKELC